jgi:hypothetical protein
MTGAAGVVDGAEPVGAAGGVGAAAAGGTGTAVTGGVPLGAAGEPEAGTGVVLGAGTMEAAPAAPGTSTCGPGATALWSPQAANAATNTLAREVRPSDVRVKQRIFELIFERTIDMRAPGLSLLYSSYTP